MLPLVGLAATFVPELIRLVAGDKAGTLAGTVAQAVQDTAGTSDPAAALQRLQADAATRAALQQRLAEIALEAAKAQDAEADQRRQDEFAVLKARLEDTSGARGTMQALASERSPIAYGAPVVSIVVTVGFFVVLALLIGQGLKIDDSNTVNIVNIAVGVLGTAFATVVNFWLGSSSSARANVDRLLEAQHAHAAQTGQLLRTMQAAQAAHLDNARAALDAVQQVATSSVAALQGASAPPLTAPAPPTPPVPAALSASAPTGSAAPPDNFDNCLKITLCQEGGYADVPGDRGGPTNMGITLAALRDWRGGRETTTDDVRRLTREEAAAIYRANYWNKAGCGHLPVGLDLMAFDFGVNSGPNAAVKCLQRVVGVTADGATGPRTLAAVKAADVEQTIEALADARLSFDRSLVGKDLGETKFEEGWIRRIETIKQVALAMASQAP